MCNVERRKIINCTQFKNGNCMHQAAPRRIFGAANCILMTANNDPRIIKGCALIDETNMPPPPGSPYINQPQ